MVCAIYCLFVYLCMRMSTSKQHPYVLGPLQECRSIRSDWGDSGLPYYYTPLLCISAVIGLLAVWRHNKPKTKNQNINTSQSVVFLATLFGGGWPAERSKWPDRPPCVCVRMGKFSTRRTSAFAGSQWDVIHLRAGAQCSDLDMKRALDDKLGAYHRHDDKLCLPVAAEPEGRAAADAFPTVAWDLLTTIPTPPVHDCSSSVHCWSHLTTKCSRSQPNCAPHRVTTHHNTSHPIHTARSYFTVSFLVCPHHTQRVTRASWILLWVFFLDLLLLARFCSRFLFFWLSFLLEGSLGNSVLCIFVCCSLFCEFLDSLHFREFLVMFSFLDFHHFREFSFWLVFVLSCQQINPRKKERKKGLAGTKFAAKLAGQDSSLRPHTNQRPPTVHPTTLLSPFPPKHTLPTPPRTHLSHLPPHPHTLNEIFLHVCYPNIPFRVCADTREGVCLTWVWIPNLGALPIIAYTHSLSICLFPWVYVVCVCFVLYLSWYLCCERCMVCVQFCIHNHLCVLFLLFCELSRYLCHGALDVCITLLLYLSSFSVCMLIILIPAYVYLNIHTHSPPLPYSYTFLAIFIRVVSVFCSIFILSLCFLSSFSETH